MSVDPTKGNTFDVEDGQFGFIVTNTSKPDASDTNYPTKTVTNDVNGDFSYGDITFDVSGTYEFTVVEDSSKTVAGVTSDGRTYKITYTVTDDGKGQLQVEKKIEVVKAGGETEKVDSVDFAKTYNPTEVGIAFAGTKTLVNTDPGTTRTIKDGEFTFSIEATNDAAKEAMPQDATTVNAGGTFTFGNITYTHVGEYTYKITELAGDDANITYDSKVYEVTVTVTDENAVLKTKVDGIPDDGMAFENSFTPSPVKGEGFSGKVTMDGRDLKGGETTITVVDPDGKKTTIKPGKDGKFSVDDPTFDKTGTYEYVITQQPGKANGVTYDKTTYTVVYKVTEDPDTHQLVVNRTIKMTTGANGKAQVVKKVNFKNKYVAPKKDNDNNNGNGGNGGNGNNNGSNNNNGSVRTGDSPFTEAGAAGLAGLLVALFGMIVARRRRKEM